MAPRKPRIHVDGGFYHVTLRGNHCQPIFSKPDDRTALEELIKDGLERWECRVHGYCWMTNHIHLVVEVADIPLGKFVQSVARRYARHFQRQRDLTGHLFERRHFARLIDVDEYLLNVIRYVHRNPVEAILATSPAEYLWSSHAAYVGLRPTPTWLTTQFVLDMVGGPFPVARKRLDRFVQAAGEAVDADDLWPDTSTTDNTDQAKSRQCHRDEPRIMYLTLEELGLRIMRHFETSLDELRGPSRNRNLVRTRAVIAGVAVANKISSLCAVGRYLNRDPSALLRAIERYRAQYPDLFDSDYWT